MAQSIAKTVEGLGASGRVFYLLDRVPEIPKSASASTEEGAKSLPTTTIVTPPTMEGNVEFSNVSFHYPSRPNELVLNDVSLKIPANSTTALVGSSGAGKSTIGRSLFCANFVFQDC